MQVAARMSLFMAFALAFAQAFSPSKTSCSLSSLHFSDFPQEPAKWTQSHSASQLNALSKKRREQLGVADNEDEYDLGYALDANTDPLISKIIAGSLIVTIIALLVVGLIIPLTTDYGEGVCNPALTAGRC